MTRITKIPTPRNDLPEPPPEKNTLTAAKREHSRKAAIHLSEAFTWDQTAEGVDFWLAVYNRLYNIGGGEVLK